MTTFLMLTVTLRISFCTTIALYGAIIVKKKRAYSIFMSAFSFVNKTGESPFSKSPTILNRQFTLIIKLQIFSIKLFIIFLSAITILIHTCIMCITIE